MAERALRVAVVGAGPAGIYATGHLLEQAAGTYLDGRVVHLTSGPIEVDLFDRLPTPWGLVRSGVAPDHPEKKLVIRVFEEITQRRGYRFFGGIEIGRDVTHDELSQWYDAVIYAVGASRDTRMGIPGERLPGCWSAREFVAWYNGHPDFVDLDFDLTGTRAVVIGNGNVALDVARILLLSNAELAKTDIADHALEKLQSSNVREVVLLGRRGPRQAAFKNPELEELGHLDDVDVVVDPAEIDDEEITETDPPARRKMALLHSIARRSPAGHSRRLVLRFFTKTEEVIGNDRVEAVRIARNGGMRTSEETPRPGGPVGDGIIETSLVLRAIGYFGRPVPGLPFDDLKGIIPNVQGRVVLRDRVIPGVYVTGWIKRGPRGIIGSNKKCSRDTVRALLQDVESGEVVTLRTLERDAVASLLLGRKPELVTRAGWRRIDNHERVRGAQQGRPRVKLTDLAAMAEISRKSYQAEARMDG